MTDLKKLARKLERIGFGVKIEEEKLIIYESWEKECLFILGVKTYKDGLAKRAEQLESEFGLKLQNSSFRKGISSMVFLAQSL